MKDRRPISPRRILWKLICLFLGLILVLMITAAAAFRFLTDQIRVSADPLPQPSVPSAPSSPKEAVLEFLDPTDVNWTQLSTDLTKKERSTINLLLIGQDQRETDTVSRADSILLCTFRKKEGKLIMTSFLRDLYLPIPGHGSDRINAAYAYGGSALLVKTLSDNFDITIDGTLEVDFSQFAKLIDTLGGVELQLREDEAALAAQAEKQEPIVSQLRQLSPAVRSRWIRGFLQANGVPEPESDHVSLVERVIFSEKPSASAHMPGGVRVCRRYDLLQVASEPPLQTCQLVQLPAEIKLQNANLILHEADDSSLTSACILLRPNGQMCLRTRQSGDKIRLSGGTKSLKKLFIDCKIPAGERNGIAVLADEKGVLWVQGFGPNLDRVVQQLPAVELRVEKR